MGPRLLHIAVADEGEAPSKKALLKVMLRNFAELMADGSHGLDDGAVADNWKELKEQAAELGIGDSKKSRKSRKASSSQSRENAEVAGSIGDSPDAGAIDPHTLEIMAQLRDRDSRLEAALELARRRDEKALPAIFVAVTHMPRKEAGQVLGAVAGFGEPALRYLLEGLGSRKAYIRQGCALALGAIGGEEAIEGLCDLLVEEPTEIWREVSRALGQVGPDAVMALLGRLRGREELSDRVAWTLANIAAQGGRRVVESLAGGRDALAAQVAKRALDLESRAEAEERQVKGPEAVREVTVNRAFSRHFFEAMGGPHVASVLDPGDESAPAMILDESDLLTEVDEEDAELLDESDLLPG